MQSPDQVPAETGNVKSEEPMKDEKFESLAPAVNEPVVQFESEESKSEDFAPAAISEEDKPVIEESKSVSPSSSLKKHTRNECVDSSPDLLSKTEVEKVEEIPAVSEAAPVSLSPAGS